MTVTFKGYEKREEIAAMLENPVRRLIIDPFDLIPRADVLAILAELDRMDLAAKAKHDLAEHRHAWEQAIIEQYVKVEDAPTSPFVNCVIRSRDSSFYRSTFKDHKAKYLLNGKGYCGTHLPRAKETLVYNVIADHEREYVAPEEAQRIYDEAQALRDKRMYQR